MMVNFGLFSWIYIRGSERNVRERAESLLGTECSLHLRKCSLGVSDTLHCGKTRLDLRSFSKSCGRRLLTSWHWNLDARETKWNVMHGNMRAASNAVRITRSESGPILLTWYRRK